MTQQSPVWTLVVPAPCAWLTANDRRDRYTQARLVKLWRTATATYARAAKLPTGLARVRIDVVARFAAGQSPVRDTANLDPTLKAVVDGLGPARTIVRTDKATGLVRRTRAAGHGLIVDDDAAHLDGPHLTIGAPMPARPFGPSGQLVLTIRAVQP